MKVDAGLVRVQQYPDIRIAFDATSTGARRRHSEALLADGKQIIDLTPAVHRTARVRYGEIVASISSRSAGTGMRANIDEFTRTTADNARHRVLPVRGDRHHLK